MTRNVALYAGGMLIGLWIGNNMVDGRVGIWEGIFLAFLGGTLWGALFGLVEEALNR